MQVVANDKPAPSVTARAALTSACVLLVMALVYQYGLLLGARRGVWIEATVTLGLPMACFVGGWIRFGPARIQQLVIFESIFNALVVATKLVIAAGSDSLIHLSRYGFVGFFILQIGGFLAAQVRGRFWPGVFQSTLIGVMILVWWARTADSASLIDANGRFLFWGGDAPLAIRLAYVLWAVNILLVQTQALPRLHQTVVHAVSIGLAFTSGEFFHARLLTASHLFVLDTVFGYARPRAETADETFAMLPPAVLAWHDAHGRRLLAWGSTLGLAVVGVLYLARVLR